LNYGDISTCSFHSTKLFHTIEGGCIIANDKVISDKIELIKRFGHNYDEHICLGINAKASEFQAAMGLCNFDDIELIISDRKRIIELYDSLLNDFVQRPMISENLKYNYAYYPVIFQTEKHTLNIIESLNNENIFPRRYFYPSLNTLSYLTKKQECLISEDISKRILCLPLYFGLKESEIEKICKNIIKKLN
jgi:dTDP-4-amino-4,6-dideoxygalactose transaminase